MNKYIEKLASRRGGLEALAKKLGVTPTPGSQWRRALRESKKYKSVREFQEAWKHKVPNTFPKEIKGKEIAFKSPKPGDTREEMFHEYDEIKDAILSLRSKGHKVGMQEGSSIAWIQPRGKSDKIRLDMSKGLGKHPYLNQVGSGLESTVESFAKSPSRGKGLYAAISKDLHKELSKRGHDRITLDPMSPVWKKKYRLKEDLKASKMNRYYIPLREKA